MSKFPDEAFEEVRQLLYKLPSAVFRNGSSGACDLQKQILDELNLLCRGYSRKYYVAATYTENGRPKGFFVLSEKEGFCDLGFSGNPAFYATVEEAEGRAEIANTVNVKDKAWEVRSCVTKKVISNG